MGACDQTIRRTKGSSLRYRFPRPGFNNTGERYSNVIANKRELIRLDVKTASLARGEDDRELYVELPVDLKEKLKLGKD